MQFRDALTLDAPKRTKDGFMAVRARAARTGTYQYSGREVDPENKHGLRDQAVVHVLRDEATVFDSSAAQSFIGKPVTDNHPSVAVTAENWRDYARGTVMGAIRDGEYLAFDLLLTDAGAISKVEGGKRELSNGYSATLEFGTFTAADGTACQARQTAISGNHVALVDQGRAGPECAIRDAACISIDTRQFTDKEPTMKTLHLDSIGTVVEVSDSAEVAINKLSGLIKGASEKAIAAQTAHDKALGEKDAKIADLEAKVLDEAAIDALADAKAALGEKCRAIFGDFDTKGKSLAEIRRAAVQKKFGDAAVKDKSDDYVEARFDAMTVDSKVETAGQTYAAPTVTDNAGVRDFARMAQY